jgi:hypothetical protein
MKINTKEYFSIEIGDYSCDITLKATVIATDEGIGHYEFWGSPGYHSDIRLSVDGKITLSSIEAVWGEDCELIEPDELIIFSINEWIDDNYEKLCDEFVEQIYSEI